MLRPGDPSCRPPAHVTFYLSPWAGYTIRLRFAAATNQRRCTQVRTRSGLNDSRRDRHISNIRVSERCSLRAPAGMVRAPGIVRRRRCQESTGR